MEGLERLSVFIAVLVIMIAWELIFPRKQLRQPKLKRWLANLGLSVLSALLMRFTIATAAVFSATYAMSHGLGVLNLIELPSWLAFILSMKKQ